MTMTADLVLNGRFLGRPITGVERLAVELTRAIAAERGDHAGAIETVMPPGTPVQPEAVERLGSGTLPPHAIGTRGGHVWEQTDLARYRPDAWLLNLCNTAPVLRRHQAMVICDAQFLLHPESYSRPFRWWYRTMLSLASRRSAIVFTISEFSRGQLEAHRLVPAGKAEVLKLGVDHLDAVVPDPSVIARHGLDARPYLLAIGSLARHKNLALLVDAFLAADLPHVDLVIAGGGNPRVFQDTGLPQGANVRYIGRVSDAELRALYAGALAFACPSLSEGFGLTPLEAMTTGCPVVATTGGAVPEVCGDAAIYADPHDRDAWTAALRRIVGDEDVRRGLAVRARARADLFTWRGAARQVLAALARA